MSLILVILFVRFIYYFVFMSLPMPACTIISCAFIFMYIWGAHNNFAFKFCNLTLQLYLYITREVTPLQNIVKCIFYLLIFYFIIFFIISYLFFLLFHFSSLILILFFYLSLMQFIFILIFPNCFLSLFFFMNSFLFSYFLSIKL